MSAREVMRSATAVRSSTGVGVGLEKPENMLVRRAALAQQHRRGLSTFSLASEDYEAAEITVKGRRFGWSEAGWWAWEDLNLRLHPERKITRVMRHGVRG